MWAYESVFYQIYPLGFCGAPFENDGKLIFKFDDKNRLINANGELQGNKLQEKNQNFQIRSIFHHH